MKQKHRGAKKGDKPRVPFLQGCNRLRDHIAQDGWIWRHKDVQQQIEFLKEYRFSHLHGKKLLKMQDNSRARETSYLVFSQRVYAAHGESAFFPAAPPLEPGLSTPSSLRVEHTVKVLVSIIIIVGAPHRDVHAIHTIA